MKHLIYIVLIVLAFMAGSFLGRCDFYKDVNGKLHAYDLKESLDYERSYCNALLEGLHWYMLDDTLYWQEMFMETSEYNKIDSINQGDWEDFYAPEWK